ncbi:methylated-DNA--[protein]-cysteine S-methyltransferase [Sediminibacillus albus]|uniref:methylated-DNA--[protein]-cysteine S-methyltransferase n=1 Tax=Sediminibacillus albus TaxID=407036 RepID=A0A1G8WN08_9BACI|nr:methylated-DNA--[protein]-cysteine S-methyltransferase [Sediminibacillus albus]SDJ79516.1 methylated-DNA-[protein]-cysteine S-methyltransferase [Sediminibacillus albus]
MESNKKIYCSLFDYENWRFYLAATSRGLCYVGSPNSPFTELEEWARRYFPEHRIIEDDALLKPYKAELMEYFQGERKTFTFPVDLQGTSFQQEIWQALQQIPYGKTYTYSQIAAMVQRPNAVRAVGAAIGANPLMISIPCHRVIGKNGKLTGFRGGLEMKKALLKLEQYP